MFRVSVSIRVMINCAKISVGIRKKVGVEVKLELGLEVGMSLR